MALTEVTSNTGLKAKLLRPLDFLVVADHAEYLGLATLLLNGNAELLADPVGKKWYDIYNSSAEGPMQAFLAAAGMLAKGENALSNPKILRNTWARNTEAAEQIQ